MQGYPKKVATRQDFLNLLPIKELKEQAIDDLQKIYSLNDGQAIIATTLIDPDDPEGGWNTEIIDNSMPMWKQKGFVSRQEVADLIVENGGEV